MKLNGFLFYGPRKHGLCVKRRTIKTCFVSFFICYNSSLGFYMFEVTCVHEDTLLTSTACYWSVSICFKAFGRCSVCLVRYSTASMPSGQSGAQLCDLEQKLSRVAWCEHFWKPLWDWLYWRRAEESVLSANKLVFAASSISQSPLTHVTSLCRNSGFKICALELFSGAQHEPLFVKHNRTD